MPTVYITAPRDDANELASTLVSEQLAACVNLVDCDSVYRWEGEVHDDQETILLAKTTDEMVEQLVMRAEEAHPYDVPCIEQFDEEWVLPSFRAWRREETR